MFFFETVMSYEPDSESISNAPIVSLEFSAAKYSYYELCFMEHILLCMIIKVICQNKKISVRLSRM